MEMQRESPSDSERKSQRVKIAIIGGGICGGSAAYYLSRHFKDLDITVFERSAQVGGRVSDIKYRNNYCELGAGIFIEENRNIVELAKTFDCPRRPADKDSQAMLCWDGQTVLYNTQSRFHLLKFFYHYGASYFKLKRHLAHSLTQFLACYPRIDLLRPDLPAFESPREFLQQTGLEDLLSQTGLDHVRDIGLKENFIKDILYGAVCGIYNNTIDRINAVAIMVTLQGIFQKAYAFSEGNNSLVRKMLVDFNDYCRVRTRTEVREVAYDPQARRYKLQYHCKQESKYEEEEDFDVVILATPFKQSNVKFSGFDFKDSMDFTNNNKQVVVTILEGKIKNEFFGLPPNGPLVENVLLAEGTDEKLPTWKSLGQSYNLKDGTCLYRIESGQPPSPQLLNSVFNNPKVVYTQNWEFAYPSLPTMKPEQLPKFRLNEGLYFPNVLEFTASCMEMETIAAKNVVKLISQYEGAAWEKNSDSFEVIDE